MVDYPTDLELDETKDIRLDASNDLSLVSGEQQLQQSVAIDVMDEVRGLLSRGLTGKGIGLLEERVRSGLEQDPQVGAVRSVSVESFDRASASVQIDVTLVRNEDFTLNLST